MKKFLLLALLLYGVAYGQGVKLKIDVPGFSQAEFAIPPGYIKIIARYELIAGAFDSGLHVPQYNGVPTDRFGVWTADGAVAVDTSAGYFYWRNGGVWVKAAKFSDIPSALTFTNGLTESAGTVRQGGSFTANTQIRVGSGIFYNLYNDPSSAFSGSRFELSGSGTSNLALEFSTGLVGAGDAITEVFAEGSTGFVAEHRVQTGNNIVATIDANAVYNGSDYQNDNENVASDVTLSVPYAEMSHTRAVKLFKNNGGSLQGPWLNLDFQNQVYQFGRQTGESKLEVRPDSIILSLLSTASSLLIPNTTPGSGSDSILVITSGDQVKAIAQSSIGGSSRFGVSGEDATATQNRTFTNSGYIFQIYGQHGTKRQLIRTLPDSTMGLYMRNDSDADLATIIISGADTTINLGVTGGRSFLLNPTGIKVNVGSDATGDIFYRNSSGFLTRLGVGSNGDVLTLASGLPSWAAASGGVSLGTNQQIPFMNAGGTDFSYTNDIRWDNTNKDLYIDAQANQLHGIQLNGSNIPAIQLQIGGSTRNYVGIISSNGAGFTGSLLGDAFIGGGGSGGYRVAMGYQFGETYKLLMDGTGITMGWRFRQMQGADVASAAGAITLGNDGNTFEITGTSAITLISNVNWQNGSEVTLLFTSTASITDGTANSGTDIGMELAGNANFTGSAGATLTLILSEIGGTQRWREKCRSVQ